MTGMKFRRTCSSCNTTFFSPDRKASICLKCSKKKIVKHIPTPPPPELRREAEPPRQVRAIPKPEKYASPLHKSKAPVAPKIDILTPELTEQVLDLYAELRKDPSKRLRDVHTEIADKLWVKRNVIADSLRDHEQNKKEFTPELKNRAIEMYQRFVETGHRPEGGRRRTISAALGVPYKQVVNLIREWSLSEYMKSPTPTPTREQLFEVEKTYWRELENEQCRLTEMPQRIAEELGFITRWQVLRWLDVLHDDEHAFDNVPDPSPEVQQQILDAYNEYLEGTNPPDHGLHYTIAGRIGKVTPRQVHKVLQANRHKKRAEYPLL